MSSPFLYYSIKKKKKKGYKIYHFYIPSPANKYNSWSVDYKVKGNKRIRPNRLVNIRKNDLNYLPYTINQEIFVGKVRIKEVRYEELLKEIKRREKRMFAL